MNEWVIIYTIHLYVSNFYLYIHRSFGLYILWGYFPNRVDWISSAGPCTSTRGLRNIWINSKTTKSWRFTRNWLLVYKIIIIFHISWWRCLVRGKLPVILLHSTLRLNSMFSTSQSGASCLELRCFVISLSPSRKTLVIKCLKITNYSFFSDPNLSLTVKFPFDAI
jgi:hypothetical protein